MAFVIFQILLPTCYGTLGMLFYLLFASGFPSVKRRADVHGNPLGVLLIVQLHILQLLVANSFLAVVKKCLEKTLAVGGGPSFLVYLPPLLPIYSSCSANFEFLNSARREIKKTKTL